MKIVSSIWVKLLLFFSSLQTLAIGGMEITQLVLDGLFYSATFNPGSLYTYQNIYNEIILVSSEIFQCILFFSAVRIAN
jgi:hypothetical protein